MNVDVSETCYEVGMLLKLLTCAGVCIGEAKVVDSIQGQQVVQELLLLVLTAEECIPLVQAPATAAKLSKPGKFTGRDVTRCSKSYLSNVESESRVRRCLERSFFSSDSLTQALA